MGTIQIEHGIGVKWNIELFVVKFNIELFIVWVCGFCISFNRGNTRPIKKGEYRSILDFDALVGFILFLSTDTEIYP